MDGTCISLPRPFLLYTSVFCTCIACACLDILFFHSRYCFVFLAEMLPFLVGFNLPFFCVLFKRKGKEDDEEEEETVKFTPPSQPASSKKSSKPSKLVDLGAAATFGTTSGNSSVPGTTTSTSSQQQQQPSLEEIFGDFSGPPADNSASLLTGKEDLSPPLRHPLM